MRECGQCGTQLGSHQVHGADICMKQQEINRLNQQGRGVPCPWCGEIPASFNQAPFADHKEGCPRRGGR